MDESSSGVSKESFPQEFGEFDFVSEEGAGDIDTLASNNGNSLTWMKERVPLRRVLATTEANLPIRCPFPSTTINFLNICGIYLLF